MHMVEFPPVLPARRFHRRIRRGAFALVVDVFVVEIRRIDKKPHTALQTSNA